ncbi:MAG TPA: MFS transporter [Nevskiaceae bacterium]
MFELCKQLTRRQRNAFIAALAGWTLDGFDFFLFVFCLKAISGEFHTDVATVAEGILLTLAFRPLGALFFGWLAEKYGRRPILMIDVAAFALVELATAFAPSLLALLILRAIFGFAMGGEWGVGAALAMETVPVKGRGFFSGVLQVGYPLGYLIAALVFGYAFVHIGWRGMFIVGALSGLLVFFIRYGVEESPAWEEGTHKKRATVRELLGAARGQIPLLVFLFVLMAFFNLFSHGSQDLYPTFLQVQHHFSAEATGNITVVMNIGGILGGILFGWLSEHWSRKRVIVLGCVIAFLAIPLWAYAPSALLFGVGAFIMQLGVQGAWGMVPAHLNELSPPAVRAILPGLAYQFGNLVMAGLGPLQAGAAESHGDNYALVLSVTLAIAAVGVAVVTLLGREARSSELRVTVE